MKTDELSLNQVLWLSINIKDKCPYCGDEIEVVPDNMGYRMGITTRDEKGNIIQKRPAGFFARCPQCDKVINIAVMTEFTKDAE